MTLENTKKFKKQVAPYENQQLKSVWQLINTVVPFVVFMVSRL